MGSSKATPPCCITIINLRESGIWQLDRCFYPGYGSLLDEGIIE